MKIFGLLAFFISAATFGFTLNPSNNSNFRGWRSAEIQFVINSSNCPAGVNVQSLLEESFEVWNQVPTSKMKLNVVGATSATSAGNPTVVTCSTNFAADLGVTDPGQVSEIENNVPGAALLSTSGDFAVSGLLILNASGGSANIALFNQTLLKVILAHEVGHIIGLGHSQDLNALMYYNASAKNSLALAQDDVDGVTYLYPRNELGGEQMMGCGRVRALQTPLPPDEQMRNASLLYNQPIPLNRDHEVHVKLNVNLNLILLFMVMVLPLILGWRLREQN